MKLKQQLIEIQRKLDKIDLYNRIIDNLKDEAVDEAVDEALMKEVAQEVIHFCMKQISTIENSVDAVAPPPKVHKTEKSVEKEELKEQKTQLEDTTLQDPLKFIVAYKSWVGKKVLVKNGKNSDVEGEVLGAAFPKLKVNVNDLVVTCDPKDLQLI